MHACIDGFVAIAERHRDDDDRCEAMQASMFDFLVDRLAAHGYPGDRDAIWLVVLHDVKLNSQGLDSWLHWLERDK